MDNYKDLIDKRIERAKGTRNFAGDDCLEKVKNFFDKLVDCLNRYEKYIKLRSNRNHYYALREDLYHQRFERYQSLKLKIETIQKKLVLLKKQEIAENPCANHSKLCNKINQTHFSKYLDVIREIEKQDIDELVERQVVKRVEEIASYGNLELERINFLQEELKRYLNIIEQNKNKLQEDIEEINKKIEALSQEMEEKWPMQNDGLYDKAEAPSRYRKSEYQEELIELLNSFNVDEFCYGDLGKKMGEDNEALCIIAGVLSNLNYFDITHQILGGKPERYTIYYNTQSPGKSIKIYIEKWIKGIFKYLSKNQIGG